MTSSGSNLSHETSASIRDRPPRAGVACADAVVDSSAAIPFRQMKSSTELPLVVLLGPTASGKSSLAVWLAEGLDGEVMACDSTQLYRGFDIGTAKPSKAERSGVAHHLIDVLDAGEEATAGGYREEAIAVLADLRGRRKLPIFTVGTGLYFGVLLRGLPGVRGGSKNFA